MPKETEFFNAASAAESTASALTKAADSSGRNGSSSSVKYRISTRLSNLSSTEAPDAALRSPETRLSTANVSSMLLRMSKNSASRLSLSGSSEKEGSTTGSAKPKNARLSLNTEASTPLRVATGTPKLPQKLRQHVNRLRNQFALGSSAGSGSSRNLNEGGRSPSPTASPHKAPRPSMSSASISSKRFSVTAAAAIQYSRRSNQLQQLQAPKEEGGKQVEPASEAPKTPALPEVSEPVSAGTFQDLLRPLQSSLSGASLSGGWSSDEDDEAEQLFRQSERESSRMLRVCCSIDNLMMSIGDQAQEQKQSEAIARGASRDLVKLFQFAMKQVVAVIFDKSDGQRGNNNSPRGEESRASGAKLDGKDAQYAMEFLLEVNERLGKLYEFSRSVFVGEVDGLHLRTKQLEEELAAAALRNEQLQTEIRDLRDFHEQNNVSAADSFSGTGSGHPGLDNRDGDAAISALAFTDISDTNTDAGDDGDSALKQQCQELSRLLEMAKQEIRLSHHERDVQKARVAEISSALFHTTELGLLRNQLQSEKKRVRVLERENLTLRESQQEQAMKLQSSETPQAASSVSTGGGNSGVHKNSFVSTRPPVDSSTSTTSTGSREQSGSMRGNEPVEEQPIPQTGQLTVETEENQYNFTHSEGNQPPDGSAVNWFLRIVTPLQPTNTRKSRKKQTELKSEQPPPVELSKFLAGLLMTEKQLVTAKEESKARRKASVPTLVPPMAALSARKEARSAEESGSRSAANKKRRPRSAATTTGSSSTAINTALSDETREDIVACCRQLVWIFYQRFLLAVEAQNLLGTRGLGGDPTLGCGSGSSAGNPSTEPVSLPLIVFHFFLERCSRELDATTELEQFVRCVHSVRSFSYSLELFCQFLEDTCSRQELCFFLWVCQAMDDVRLGVPYEDPLPGSYEPTGPDELHSSPTEFLCVLKATFLARTIFRLLNFKVLCRPLAGGSKRRGKSKRNPTKRSNSTIAVVAPPTSPLSSPKRKPKTRIGEITAALPSPSLDSAVPVLNTSEHGQEEQKQLPAPVAAQAALREIIESNEGQPITLETFNNLLLKFAVVPSMEELAARLGPFYQPTGDERKVPSDVFLALLMETYKFQVQWQRDQLRALFIHLNHQEDLQQRTAEKLSKTETTNDKGGRRKSTEDKKLRPRMQRRKSRDGATDNGGGSKYLRGLTRSVLRELLLESEIVHDSDVAQVDIDWLFAELLKAAGGVATDITFDGVYDAFQKMRWLDSNNLRVDALGEVTGVAGASLAKRTTSSGRSLGIPSSSKSRTASATIAPMVQAIRSQWRVYARHSLALCNNDPNVFVRRHSQRLLHYVDQELVRLVGASESPNVVSANGGAVQCIRDFLSFAWRVAAKRSCGGDDTRLQQTCLTEVFLVSQALRATADAIPGYDAQDKQELVQHPRSNLAVTQDALQSFYDVSRMNLTQFFKAEEDTKAAEQLHALELVLALYSTHIAHLFQRFSEARYNCLPQVAFHRWKAMLYELEIVHPRNLPLPKLQTLFMSVAGPQSRSGTDGWTPPSQELGVEKTQFSELLVLVAIERHRAATARKLEKAQLTTLKKPRSARDDNKDLSPELSDRPARIMAQFCREVLAPRAFRSDSALVERNFTAKLSCPLVGRALLEHRAFLRSVFFYYAKQDEVEEDERAAQEEQALIHDIQENGGQLNQDSNPIDATAALLQLDPGSDFQLEKTKRSSMSFGEFQTFLTAFGLLDAGVALADAHQVFSSVMSLENDDTLQLEFDEFAAAIVALAVHLSPSPFTLWHQKLDVFATRLRRRWETQNEGTRSIDSDLQKKKTVN